jgi:hypothetical protein
MVKSPLAQCPFVVRTLDVPEHELSDKDLCGCFAKSEEVQADYLTEDEVELLQNVREDTFRNNTDRASSLGWHRSRYSEARKSLLSKELIEEVSFKTKLRGAPSHFLKVKDRKCYGRGQFIHAYWVEKIFNYLAEKRLNPKKEYRISDKVADIAYRKDGKTMLIEVEYKSDWKGNIQRASKLCDRLISIFVREKDVVDALNFVKEQGLQNVTVTDAYYAYMVLP